MDEDITRVIFRRYFKKRDTWDCNYDNIIALFPDEQNGRRPGMVNSYMHMGQHGEAHIQGVMDETKPATPEEYGPLKKELEKPPYNYRFKVIKRRPH